MIRKTFICVQTFVFLSTILTAAAATTIIITIKIISIAAGISEEIHKEEKEKREESCRGKYL